MVTAERMTKIAIRARLQALVEASASGRYRVEPQHLLLELLREAKPLFALCSLDTEAVKNDVQKTFPRITNRPRVDPEESPETGRLNFEHVLPASLIPFGVSGKVRHIQTELFSDERPTRSALLNHFAERVAAMVRCRYDRKTGLCFANIRSVRNRLTW